MMGNLVNCRNFFVLCCFALLFSASSVSAKEVASDQELTIVAHVTVKAANKDEVVNAFKKVVEGTRKEPGNVSYILMENINDPLKFTFIEVWKSQEAIDAHNKTAHFNEFVKAIEGKADLDVHTLKKKF